MSKKLRTKELEWDRGGEWVSPCLKQPSGDLWMCADDLGLEVWSQLHHSSMLDKSRQSEVRLDCCSADLRRVIADALSRQGHYVEIADVIADFARMLAQELFYSGRATFEIKRGRERQGDNSVLREVQFLFLPRESLLDCGVFALQVIPKGHAREFPKAIRLPTDRLIRFTMPRQYRKSIRMIRRAAPLLDRARYQMMMEPKENDEFTTINRQFNIEQAKVFAPIGWNGRGAFRDHIADFHFAARQLRWVRFCVDVRESIITTLENAISTIGSWFGEAPRLHCAAFPSVEDIVSSEIKLFSSGGKIAELVECS